jgi:hypothetical protein
VGVRVCVGVGLGVRGRDARVNGRVTWREGRKRQGGRAGGGEEGEGCSGARRMGECGMTKP